MIKTPTNDEIREIACRIIAKDMPPRSPYPHAALMWERCDKAHPTSHWSPQLMGDQWHWEYGVVGSRERVEMALRRIEGMTDRVMTQGVRP